MLSFSNPAGLRKQMRIDVLTLFPEMFQAPFSASIRQRAMSRGLVQLCIHNFRDFATDKHHVVDDTPYGGGAGMVLKPEPLFDAVEGVLSTTGDKPPVILLTPQGRLFNQETAVSLSVYPHLVLICGHYEGFDERVRRHLASDELSIGDYVLSGGELAAMVVVDAVTRLLPGVLGSEASPMEESHSGGLLEYPQYTRPAVFRDWPVPEVLLSGNHAQVARWRRQEAIRRTLERRPELLERATLTPGERRFVASLRQTDQA